MPRRAPSLHQRIRRDLEAQILGGHWRPGDRIPSEHALMAQYACSRMTVNKVLSALAHNGLIERRRRAGSFVARPSPHLEQAALEIPDIAAVIRARGHDYTLCLIEREPRCARMDSAEEMQLSANGGELLALTCLHLADQRPLALEQRKISLIAVPEARAVDFSRHPPGSWLLQHAPWTRAEHRISAVAATPEQAALLDVRTGSACLRIERRTWRGEQPITWVRQLFPGDAYELIARFSPGGGSS